MSGPRQLITGTLAMVAAVLATAWLSSAPAYRSLPEGAAMLRLSFAHGGARTCRPMTDEELAKLPPNMRRREVCERERAALYLELDIDGATVYRADLPPTGLAGDGPSRVYRGFVLPAGTHEIGVRMRDSGRAEGFDYRAERQIGLAPGQNFVIDFRPEAGGFVFD